MKNNNQSTFIVIMGIVVLSMFTVVAARNLIPGNNESDSYYVKVEEDMSAKIESLDIKKNKLKITMSGDAVMFCVKSTKSTPKSDALCWKEVKDNTATISVYKDEKYYVWIKDTKGNISIPMSINTND